jgi:hypothetical protein
MQILCNLRKALQRFFNDQINKTFEIYEKEIAVASADTKLQYGIVMD